MLALLALPMPLAAQPALNRATDGVTISDGARTLPIHWFAPAEESRWRPLLQAVARKHGGPAPSSCADAMTVARGTEADAPRSYAAYCARMGDKALPVKVCWDDSMADYAIGTMVGKRGTKLAHRALALFVTENCWGN
jgi:hypothetical protein